MRNEKVNKCIFNVYNIFFISRSLFAQLNMTHARKLGLNIQTSIDKVLSDDELYFSWNELESTEIIVALLYILNKNR